MKSDHGHKKIVNEQTGIAFDFSDLIRVMNDLPIDRTPRELELALQEELQKLEKRRDEIMKALAKIRGKKKNK